MFRLKRYSATIMVKICLIAILTLGMISWNREIAEAKVESAITIDEVRKESGEKGWDFWIIDINAIDQRLFLRPLLYKKFKPDSFTVKKVMLHLPQEVCSKTKIVNSLGDGVSISCITKYLQNMMDDFIKLDSRRKGIISFNINIPMAIQSQYTLNGVDSENVRMYELNYVFSYVRAKGIMIRSIDARFIEEFLLNTSLQEIIQNEWKRHKLIFRGDNSFYGPAISEGQN